MTRFRLMLFALSCTVIFMVIVLAIITFLLTIEPQPV
jgi:hypothetical protein